MLVITADILKRICTRTSFQKLQSVADALNKVCPLYGIDNADIMHEFLANIIEESGEFTRYEENLNYSAERLMVVWPNRFPTLIIAKQFERNPQKLAEKVYGNRKELGNIQPDDGWTFRGGGPIQITGRSNYTNFTSWMRKKFGIEKPIAEWAQLLRTDDEYGIHSACWIFAIAFSLNDEAMADDMKTIVKRINGGLTNYSLRLKYYELCKKYIK